MPNAFSESPVLDPSFPKQVSLWTCPITGLKVPKDSDANLQWRADLLKAADNDPELQQSLYTACSQSILFFVNAFCFTLRVFESHNDGSTKQAANSHLPYVTWEIQDRHIARLEHGIDEGMSLLTDKSRDMGATWDHIITYAHRLIFRADESHLMISRKEDVLDILDGSPKNYPFGSLSDPGTLFGKIDYVLSRLPEWMLPRLSRKKLHLVNLDNRTRIDGESSNASAGSGDRRTSIYMDEFAKVAEAEAIKRSTKDVTACRFVCSTPNGAGTTYSKWRMSGQIPVFIMPWWEHPQKGAGRFTAQDALGRWTIRSPWYDGECLTRSPKELAIELNMDHIGSGDTFFESVIIEQHKKMFARNPKRMLNISFKKNIPDDKIPSITRTRSLKDVQSTPDLRGKWCVWCELPSGRPDQTKSYTLGIDIGKGQGASNSTVSIMRNEDRIKVASFADANTSPHEFARLVVAVAIWCGGKNKLPLIVWENNGDPGFFFGEQLTRVYQYPNIYFDRQAGTLRQRIGKRWGWRSSPEKKAIALGLLRRAYAHGKFINHDEKALDEALTYIHYEGGGIGPAELVNESEANRKSHGDRVIADMLCLVGQKEMPRMKRGEYHGPQNSIGARLAAFKLRKRGVDKSRGSRMQQKRFNFQTESAA